MRSWYKLLHEKGLKHALKIHMFMILLYLVGMHDFLSCIHYNTTVVLCNVTIRTVYWESSAEE